jgi:hypothetical protein
MRNAVVAALPPLLATGLGPVARAQQTPYVAGSTVTGHIFCADTNAPARFAKVVLKPTEDRSGEEFMKRFTDNLEKLAAKKGEAGTVNAPAVPDKPLPEVRKKAIAAANKGMTQALEMMNASTVGMDGFYSFSGVKAGTYYVHVLYPGYIDPFSQFSDEDFASADPAIRARIAQIPTVTPTGTDSAHADLRIERGAAIGGRVLYDDGSPAAGWILSVVKPGTPGSAADASELLMSQALAMSGAAQIAKTDDLGRYRIAGLAAGSYAVRATLVATPIGITAANIGDGGSGINLTVFSGDTFNRADAKPIAVSAGEEFTGADIAVPARSLHNIAGHVYAQADAHTLNVGQVVLTSKSDPALHATAAIRDDGGFHFEYLPGGVTYTLSVEGAADGRNGGSSAGFLGMNIPHPEILRKYGTATADVALSGADIDNVSLTVAQTDWKPPVKKPGAPDANPGDLLNGIFGAATGALTGDKP